jgi:hypothetical protein
MPSEHTQLICKVLGQIGEAQGPEPASRQLDREWNPIEGAADPDNCRGVVSCQLNRGPDRPSAIE